MSKDREHPLTLVKAKPPPPRPADPATATKIGAKTAAARGEQAKARKRTGRLERRRDVLQLRAAGATVEQIAQALDCSARTVGAVLQKLYEEWDEEIADLRGQVLGLELHRLDELLQGVWPRALNRAPRGQPPPYSWADQREAVDTVLRLMERRARFLGLDAPDKFVHEHLVHHEVVDQKEVERLESLRQQRRLPPDIEVGPDDVIELPALTPSAE